MPLILTFFAVPGTFEPRTYAWFGIEHSSWLLAMTIAGIIAAVSYRRLTRSKQILFLKIFASCIVFSEVARQMIYLLQGAYRIEYLPLHLCAVTELFCFLYAFRQDSVSREFLYWLGLPGALSALLFADWLWFPLWNFQSIQSFFVHGAMSVFAILLLVSGESKPSLKGWPPTFAIATIFALPLFFLNKLWGTNFFFLNTPSPGSPLVIFEKIAGNPGYIGLLLVLVLVVWILMALPWFWVRQTQKRKMA